MRRKWDSTASIINAFTTFLLFPFSSPAWMLFCYSVNCKTAEHNVSLPKIPERLPPDFTGSVASQVQELNFIAVLLVNSDVMVMAAVHTNFREN